MTNIDISKVFNTYLLKWKMSQATAATHGWDGWYLERGYGTQTVIWPPKPQGSKKWAEKMLKQMNKELEAAND